MHPGMPPGASGAASQQEQPLGAPEVGPDARLGCDAGQAYAAQFGGLAGAGAISAPAPDEGYREYYRCAAAAAVPQGPCAAHPAVIYGGDGLAAGFAGAYAGIYGGQYGDAAGAEVPDHSSAAAWGNAMGAGGHAQPRMGAPGDAACRQATYAWQQGAKCAASSP